MKILAIETSCDETGIALLDTSGPVARPKVHIIRDAVSSQIAIHRPFGGVVPGLAKREHIKNLPIVLEQVLGKNPEKQKIDAIAVTVGPGLEPALWTGITFAKEIHKKYFPKAKLIGVNHLEGHLYSFLLTKKNKTRVFPSIALVVSGGHTILSLMQSMTKRKKLGETCDDAVGEAFDKVARLLNLPYPGGPEIEKLAERGNPRAIPFPRPMMHTKDYDFSFSGLKTAVLYYMRDHKGADRADVAASFSEAAVETLVKKTMRAAKQYKARSVMLSGGVAANKRLRSSLEADSKKLKLPFFVAPFKFNTDNAVMIGVAGYMTYVRRKNHSLRAQGNLNL